VSLSRAAGWPGSGFRKTWRWLTTLAAPLALPGCAGQQSVLAPHGPEAEEIATLALVLFAGGTGILAAVVGLAALAVVRSPGRRRWLASERLVVWGGLVVPAAILTATLAYGLSLTGSREAPDEPAALTVEVIGERWWWRVHYLDAAGTVAVPSANEIRLPVGQPVELRLRTADVLHSLWVPNLAGKLDMVPGHVNHLRVEASQTGVFRGQCAEFCGGEHAWMAFDVVAMPPADFTRWMARSRGPAAAPGEGPAARGAHVFTAVGCGACHTVRGTAATGTIGPDLTRFGERRTLAAGRLPNDHAGRVAWIAGAEHLKPGNGMPSFGFLGPAEIEALAAYLEGLR
jgi:cytochrome c oxidase subunit 2